MYEAFFSYLGKFSDSALSESEKDLMKRTFVPHRLKKKQYLLQAGDHCKNFAFIVKGAMRMYSADEKGFDHIVRLGVENWWMGDRESWSMAQPSRYHIDAWEDCDLLYITREGSMDLQKQVPAFCEMKLQLDERNHIANNRRLTSAISETAEQRYLHFAECYPELKQRFPQHIIASYLGINKDTLSRIRRQLIRR
ncbi:Crp/Fnr family transcriptional regulator [Mucilaginibacter defluvii]|uniref:Crp/Fnr family transcriptional regulator n=1 Tax=Mucilaginibacter defluvii TaxID=1196019 RepID=A0ABP9FUX6_9SPHI